MAKQNKDKKDEKAKNGNGKKPQTPVEAFGTFYIDYAAPRGITSEIKEGKRSFDDLDVYNAISVAGQRIDPDTAGVDLPRPALIGILDAWYENSRTKLMDYVLQPKNLEKVVSGTYAGRISCQDILGAKKDENGRLGITAMSLRAPKNTKGYEELATAHSRFYTISIALQNKDRQAISQEIAPSIEQTLTDAGVSNPDKWKQIFSYLASVNEQYAFAKAGRMLVTAYDGFKKYNSLSGENKREYFGRVIGDTVTKKGLEETPNEVERALDLLYAYTAKAEKKAEKKDKKK